MGEDVAVPLFVRFGGARVVAIGAGPVAARKLETLLAAGADVVVVAPDADPDIAAAADDRRLTWHARTWQPADLDGALLVLAATADAATNAAVAEAAAQRATLCIRVDAGGRGSADLAAAVRRGPLTFAVSTDGQAPVLARHLRRELQDTYGPEWGQLVALYGQLRRDPAIRASLAALPAEERARRWRAIPVPDILRMLRNGDLSSAKRAASACLSSSSA